MTAVQSLFLNLRQVAALLGVNYCTAWGLVNTGQLRGFQVGRRWKVPQAAIDDFIQAVPAPQLKRGQRLRLQARWGGST